MPIVAVDHKMIERCRLHTSRQGACSGVDIDSRQSRDLMGSAPSHPLTDFQRRLRGKKSDRIDRGPAIRASNARRKIFTEAPKRERFQGEMRRGKVSKFRLID